jgi:hypothetical protein
MHAAQTGIFSGMLLPADVWGACSGEIPQSLDEPPVILAQYTLTGRELNEHGPNDGTVHCDLCWVCVPSVIALPLAVRNKMQGVLGS